MRKQVLVTVDRGETRVAILEAEGAPSAAAKDSDDSKPAARGRAIVVGPYTEHITEFVEGLAAVGGVVRMPDPASSSAPPHAADAARNPIAAIRATTCVRTNASPSESTPHRECRAND